MARCPHAILRDPWIEEVRVAYTMNRRENGGWPFPGQWPDQPAPLVEAFLLLDSELAAYDREAAEER